MVERVVAEALGEHLFDRSWPSTPLAELELPHVRRVLDDPGFRVRCFDRVVGAVDCILEVFEAHRVAAGVGPLFISHAPPSDSHEMLGNCLDHWLNRCSEESWWEGEYEGDSLLDEVVPWWWSGYEPGLRVVEYWWD